MAPRVSVILPAYNEADTIGGAIAAVREALGALGLGAAHEILVIDDGSRDDTEAAARAAGGAAVVRFARNRGKGAALEHGFRAARGEVLLMLDADLAGSAGQCERLLGPVLRGEADMTVAVLPPTCGGGFGTVVRVARWGVRRLTGRHLAAPLSGQRALTRAVWEAIGRVAPGYGAEVGLDVDALRAGFRLLEVPTEMAHRAHGRSWAGFRHRGRQLLAVVRTLLARSLGR